MVASTIPITLFALPSGTIGAASRTIPSAACCLDASSFLVPHPLSMSHMGKKLVICYYFNTNAMI